MRGQNEALLMQKTMSSGSEYQLKLSFNLRYGLVVRIAGSHPAGPGSIPGNGISILTCLHV
jgi:hypothetical protein